jgi:hypothetical protein
MPAPSALAAARVHVWVVVPVKMRTVVVAAVNVVVPPAVAVLVTPQPCPPPTIKLLAIPMPPLNTIAAVPTALASVAFVKVNTPDAAKVVTPLSAPVIASAPAIVTPVVLLVTAITSVPALFFRVTSPVVPNPINVAPLTVEAKKVPCVAL